MDKQIVSYRGTKRILRYYVEGEIPEHTIRYVRDFLCKVIDDLARAIAEDFNLENNFRGVQHLRRLKRLPKSYATDLLSRATVELNGIVENADAEPIVPNRQT